MVLPTLAIAGTAMADEGQAVVEAATGSSFDLWLIAPISSIIALVFAVYFYKKMMSASEGSEKMITIAKHVREGAYAYLRKPFQLKHFLSILKDAVEHSRLRDGYEYRRRLEVEAENAEHSI